MTDPTTDRSEILLRYSRRSMFVTLVFILAMGSLAIALAISPDGAASRFLGSAPWLIPIAIVLVVGAMQATLQGNRWTPQSPEVQAIMSDEWRRSNIDRALRVAFVAVLIVQIPLALLFTVLHAQRALFAMAASTITLGLALVAGLFLVFDRE